jgi:hypothetical protein
MVALGRRTQAASSLSAMPRVGIGPALPDRDKLDIEIARLRDLNVNELRGRWQAAFGRPTPPHLPRQLTDIPWILGLSAAIYLLRPSATASSR